MSTQCNVNQLFSLRGKVALITGATGYLGSAMVDALAEAGASVVVSSRKLDSAKAVADRLPRADGATHHAIAIDQTDEASIQSGFASAIAQAGKVDILINNGHQPIGKDWRTVTGDEFTKQLSNATGYFLLARLLRDHAVERKSSASIVTLGSMYGVVGSYPDAYDGFVASPVAYHALKGGIVQMTRHLAVYWAGDGVRVNCLSPGPFPQSGAPEVLVDRLKAKSPMKRMGKPEELKGAVVFLASDASSYMTGQNLIIDGGWTAW